MNDILTQITHTKQQEISLLKSLPNRFAALFSQAKPILITEVKPRSPSAGTLYPGDPLQLVHHYQEGGTDALSILTDTEYFGGSPRLLQDIRDITDLPILRKDFILDQSQLLETLRIGADAILLIVSILDDDQLKHLIDFSHSLGLFPLVEVYDEAELQRALQAGAICIGVNARNLNTFEIDPLKQQNVLKMVPDGIISLSLSGINTPEDLTQIHQASAPQGYLIGTSLLKSADITQTVRNYQTTLKNFSTTTTQ